MVKGLPKEFQERLKVRVKEEIWLQGRDTVTDYVAKKIKEYTDKIRETDLYIFNTEIDYVDLITGTRARVFYIIIKGILNEELINSLIEAEERLEIGL